MSQLLLLTSKHDLRYVAMYALFRSQLVLIHGQSHALALQGSGLIKTVGLCAQRRVALMSQAIKLARECAYAFSNNRRKAPLVSRGKVCSLSYLSMVW